MAKAKSSSTIKTLDDYIQVTDKNKKVALQVGSHFWIIVPKGKQYEVLQRAVIRPRLKKGMITVTRDAVRLMTVSHEFYVRSEETPDEYANNMAPIKALIDQGCVYVHKTNKTKAEFSIRQ